MFGYFTKFNQNIGGVDALRLDIICYLTYFCDYRELAARFWEGI